MSCPVCGSSEFIVNSGVLYCAECSTQQEATRDEQSADIITRRTLLSSPSVEKISKEKKQKASTSQHLTIEYLNVILFQQVQALINLGASPKLKQTVLYIWSKYLSKCEIAFRTDCKADENMPRFGPLVYKRDIEILFGKKRVSKKNQPKMLSENEEKSEENITDKSTTDGESQSDTEVAKPQFSSHVRRLRRIKGKKKRNKIEMVFSMHIRKTLSFCYLGLLFTGDKISLCDLIRFTKEEKIPYINAVDKMPSEYSRSNNVCSARSVPEADYILHVAHKISNFLKLPEFKIPSIFLAVSHFVKEFNLPDDLKPIIKILFEQYKEELNQKNAKMNDIAPDCLALVFIIIALKMLLVLDDKFEIEHSKVMTKLNKKGCNFFVWTEWKKQACLKEYLFLSKVSESGINKFDSLSADKILTKYPYRKATKGQSKSCDFAVSDKLLTTISDLVNIPQEIINASTSFPLTQQVNQFMNEWRTLPMYKETEEIDFTLLKKDFSSYSLLFNPLHYKTKDMQIYTKLSSLYIPASSINEIGEHYCTSNQVIRTCSDYWFLNYNRNTTDFISEILDKVPLSFKWLLIFFSKYTNHSYCSDLYEEVIKVEKLLLFQKKNIYSSFFKNMHNKLIDF